MTLPYSYVPGKFPHPLRDPAGHQMGSRDLDTSRFSVSGWRDDKVYVWGIELFNTGYYWESHECWEAVWHHEGRRGPTADMLKGLIKLAAAGVKAREGRAAGVRSHANRARQLFQGLQSNLQLPDRFLGLDLSELATHARTVSESAEQIVDTGDANVIVVMPFQLNCRDDESTKGDTMEEDIR